MAGLASNRPSKQTRIPPCHSFLPLLWSQKIAVESFNRINSLDPRADRSVLVTVLDSIVQCRRQCAGVLFEVYLPFPVLLSQLVTILTYSQVALTILAQQNSMDKQEPYFYFPLFTCLETLVYVGGERTAVVGGGGLFFPSKNVFF